MDPASQVAGQKRKLEIPVEAEASSLEPPNEENSPKKKTKKAQKPKKPLDYRFGGKTEEELMQLLLPDHLKPDLDIVFVSKNTPFILQLNELLYDVTSINQLLTNRLFIFQIGINPGLLSAYLGHHYCNANNHFC